MPEGFSDSVAAHPPHQKASDWTKGRGSSPKGAGVFLDTFCTSKKYPGVRGREGPAGKHPGSGKVNAAPGGKEGSLGRAGPNPKAEDAGKRRGLPPLFLRAGWLLGSLFFLLGNGDVQLVQLLLRSPRDEGIPRGPLTGFDLRGASESPLAPRFCPEGKTLERRKRRPAMRGPVEQKAGPRAYSAVSSSFLVMAMFSSSSCFCVPHGMRASRGGP